MQTTLLLTSSIDDHGRVPAVTTLPLAGGYGDVVIYLFFALHVGGEFIAGLKLTRVRKFMLDV